MVKEIHARRSLGSVSGDHVAFEATANNVNPVHVTYVRKPSMDNASYGIVSDHAYWVSNITERDTSLQTGTIDIFSHGFGVGDPRRPARNP